MSGQIFLESAELSVSEVGGTILIAIVRTGDLSQPVTITFGTTSDTATVGEDFEDATGSVVMEAGQSRVLVPVSILDDEIGETTESFVMSLISVDSGSLLAPRTARIDILDNESPVTDPPEPGLISTHELVETDLITGLNLPISAQYSSSNPNLLYIAEKGGIIKTLDLTTGETGVFMDISDQVNSNSDRGLMNIVLHPDFENNPYVYAYYVADPPDGTGGAGPDLPTNRYAYVSRFTADAATGYTTVVEGSEVVLVGGGATSADDISGDGLVRSDQLEHIDLPPSDYDPVTGEAVQDYLKVDSTSHVGGGLAFGPDGMLYIGVGDGVAFNFVDPRAISVQDINSLSGKVLRVDPMTGSGLADNPFATDDLYENASRVYQLGLRNPFRIAFDQNGQILISETGWNTFEEINSGGAGANFGWPYYEGGDAGVILQTEGYNALPTAAAFYAAVEAGDIQITPAWRAFAHASSAPGYQIQAITGSSHVFLSDVYGPEFDNHYFFSDFSGNEIYTVDVNDRRDVTFLGYTDSLRGPVDFFQGPDGYLYYVDIVGGRIVKIDDIVELGEATVIATPAREVLNGSAGNDTYIFAPGTSTGTYLDTIASWAPGDIIDLSALHITADDLEVRILSDGALIKILVGDGPDDFQLKIELNGFSVEQILSSIIYEPLEPGANRAPNPSDDNLSLEVDGTIVFNPLDNDSDPDGDEIAVTSHTSPSFGSLLVLEDGSFQYTPNAGFTGTDSFIYTVTDANGATSSAGVSLTVVDPDAVNIIEATPAFDLLEGTDGTDRFVFSPGDSTTASIDYITGWNPGDIIDLSALGLTIDDLEVRLISGGSIVKLIAGFESGDFQLKIQLNGYSAEDVINALVFDSAPTPNQAPTPLDDTIETTSDLPGSVDVLANDTDPDGDTLSLASFTHGTNGTVQDLGNGVLQYTPDTGFAGTDSFTYDVSDPDGLVSTATVNVVVAGAPVENIIEANPGQEILTGTDQIDRFVFEPGDSTPSAIDVVANWRLGDVIDLTALGVTIDDLETRIISGGATLKLIEGFGANDFQLKINLNGYSVNDVLASLIFDGTPAPNTPPTATDDAAGVAEGSTVQIDVLANDTDTDGDALTVATIAGTSVLAGDTVALASGNTVTLNADGTLTFDALYSGGGSDSFSYSVSDGEDTDSAAVNVTITAPPVVLYGTEENDAINVPLGTDQVFALGGDDTISMVEGISLLDGGLGGNDWALFSNFAAGIDVNLAAGTFHEFGSGHDGTIVNISMVTGTTYADVIVGTDQRDFLWGNGGVDQLLGLGGDDNLMMGNDGGSADGGAGLDYLVSGFGTDIFTGGADQDAFAFYSIDRLAGDVITDLEAGEIIYLTDNSANVGWGFDRIFIGQFEFSGAAGEVRYVHQGADTLIEVDADGDSNADGILTLQGFAGEIEQTYASDGSIGLSALAPPAPLYNDINFSAGVAEQSAGTAGADRYVFEPGDSTSSALDFLTNWEPQDAIDLSALGLTLDDFEIRLVGGGTIMKLIQGFGADDFQLKISLNGHSVQDVLDSIIFDEVPVAEVQVVSAKSSTFASDGAFDFGSLSAPVQEVSQPVSGFDIGIDTGSTLSMVAIDTWTDPLTGFARIDADAVAEDVQHDFILMGHHY